jgi:hypothetical protein
LGKKVFFVHGATQARKYSIVNYDGATYTIFNPFVRKEEGPVSMFVRPIVRKFLIACYNKQQDTIELHSTVSGNIVKWFKYADYATDSWGWFERQTEEALDVNRFSVVIWPQKVYEAGAEAMAEFQVSSRHG